MQVVSDTSPLSALAIIGRLGLLREQFGLIRIPWAVWIELKRLENNLAKQALEQACDEGWLQVQETTKRSLVDVLCATLDMGESEAIALACEWPAGLLLIDESAGRVMARSLNIRLTGTLGVLLRAKQEGGILSMGVEMERLVLEAGFFVAERIRKQFLAEAGEA
jgi:hypothetical protein